MIILLMPQRQPLLHELFAALGVDADANWIAGRRGVVAENLPEVAAYYSVWHGLRDTLEGYYKNRPRQHNPFSQQKELSHQERNHSGSGAFALPA